jgi:hypothetical protein
MTQDQVVALMESSKTRDEWNANCDAVKAACGGYPDFWYAAVILSGLAGRVAARWGSEARRSMRCFRDGRTRSEGDHPATEKEKTQCP